MNVDDLRGELVLRLYRGARTVSSDQFRQWALELLEEHIRFDSAFWGVGYVTDTVVITAFTLHNLPVEMMLNYEKYKEEDMMGEVLFCSPGRTIDYRDVISPEAFHRSRIYREHSARFGLEELIATLVVDPLTRLLNVLSLYRSTRDDCFSPEEKSLMQFVVPHLVEAATLNHFYHVLTSGLETEGAMATCDGDGMLHQSESSVAELLQQEWPRWQGPKLPGSLVELLDGAEERLYEGENIRVIVQRNDGTYRLLVRQRSALDALTLRERKLAELLAQGKSYKEVSELAGIARSTVTNHANRIYSKLGVRNKAELGQVIRGGVS